MKFMVALSLSFVILSDGLIGTPRWSGLSRLSAKKVDDQVDENTESVHLKLTDMLDHESVDEPENKNVIRDEMMYEIFEYVSTTDGEEAVVLASLGGALQNLELYSVHMLGKNLTSFAIPQNSSTSSSSQPTSRPRRLAPLKLPSSSVVGELHLNRRTIDLRDTLVRDEILELWRGERLISQHRDPVGAAQRYLRSLEEQSSIDVESGSGAGSSKESFREVLESHVRRMELIYSDSVNNDADLAAFMEKQDMRRRISNENGDASEETKMMPVSWQAFKWSEGMNRAEAHSNLKNVLTWFQQEFPYYYDTCQACKNREGNLFVGFVHPAPEEKSGYAGRTELYACGAGHFMESTNSDPGESMNSGLPEGFQPTSQQHTSRFPRFNAVNRCLDTRRGRCGEYSVLCMRILRLLGYQVRWVVDWADHVWTEVAVPVHNLTDPLVASSPGWNHPDKAQLSDTWSYGREGEREWIHIDPCEAAVDEPLLYESWGKTVTYVIAFMFRPAFPPDFAQPPQPKSSSSSSSSSLSSPPSSPSSSSSSYSSASHISTIDVVGHGGWGSGVVEVVDVTHRYTANFTAASLRRENGGETADTIASVLERVNSLQQLKAKGRTNDR
jgi:hypothetical protein